MSSPNFIIWKSYIIVKNFKVTEMQLVPPGETRVCEQDGWNGNGSAVYLRGTLLERQSVLRLL
jgi:hypothetical protein